MTSVYILREIKQTVEKALHRLFLTKREEAARVDQSLTALVEAIAEFTLRPAKRLRPYLVQLGFSSFSDLQLTTYNPQLLSAMMAVELFQSFALIHDDIMDEDAERRGGQTIHEKFKVESKKLKVKNAKHFGTSMAILAGDLALVWADECMSKVESPKSKVQSIYRCMKEEVIFGQTLDVMKQDGNKNISQEKINELKTAWYSVVRPLQIGAVLAGATEKTLSALADYGVPVGKLFQLKDDLMDKEITRKQFDQQSIPLQKEVNGVLDAFDAPQKSKSALAELARFVIERTS